MKKLHKLFLKEFIGPLILTFFLSLFILLMQYLWKYLDDMVGKGIEISVIGKFMFYSALTLVPLALPLAILLASLMCMGNLGERYELVAMKAAGIPLTKAIRPLVVLAFLISGVAFYFSNNIQPYAYMKYRATLRDIQTKKPSVNIREGEYYDQIDGYVIRIGEKERDGKTIHNVQIYDHNKPNESNRLTIAKDGYMENTIDNKTLVFILKDGYSYDENFSSTENRRTRPFAKAKFEEQRITFDLSSFAMTTTDIGGVSKSQKMNNLSELREQLDTLYNFYDTRINDISTLMRSHFLFLNYYYYDSTKAPATSTDFSKVQMYNVESAQTASAAYSAALTTKGDVDYYALDIKNRQETIYSYENEVYRKYALPFACMVLFFIAAPLGAIIRKGGFGMPAVVAVLFFLAYHVLSMIGESSSAKGGLTPLQGMWLSTFVLLPVGIFLTIKATSDAALLDADMWKRRITKLFSKS